VSTECSMENFRDRTV